MAFRWDINEELVQLIGLLNWVFGEDTIKILWDTKLRHTIKYLKVIYGYKNIDKYLQEEYDEQKTMDILKILLDYKDYQAFWKDEKK